MSQSENTDEPNQPDPPEQPGRDTEETPPELAHVLFMDLVAYSRLVTDDQKQVVEELRQLVRSTAEFQRASAAHNLISLPAGDGMALVFFQDPLSPIQCALELAS